MFWYGGSHWAFWQAALMWLVAIAFFAAVVWIVAALVGGATHRPGPRNHEGDALEILDTRLAKGEIDAEEYQRLRDLILRRERTSVGAGDAK